MEVGQRRPRSLCRLVALALCAGGALWGWSAHAQREAIEVVFDAPATCPSSEQLRSEIAARTARVSFASGQPGARLFKASVSASESGFVGSLETIADGRASEPRHLRAESCADVVSALALMIAIAVDPRAATAPASALPKVLPVTAASTSAAPLASSEKTIPLQGQKAPAPAALPPTTKESGPAPWSWSAGAGAIALGGTAPNVALGAGAFVQTHQEGKAGGVTAARLGLNYADSSLLGSEARELDIRLVSAQLQGCAFGAMLPQGFRVFPCAGLEVGTLWAEGRAIAHPEVQTRWHSSLTLGGYVQALLSRALYLDAGVGASFPLLQRTFVFENPHKVVYEMPSVGWAATIGLGFRIL